MIKSWLSIIAVAGMFLIGCDSDSDSVPGNSCTTNVAGCDTALFSCPAAQQCYTTVEGCAQSGECPAAAQPATPTTGSCTTNVEGCEASAYSCPAAQSCYTTVEACTQSNECT
jgi:hypothetical protein